MTIVRGMGNPIAWLRSPMSLAQPAIQRQLRNDRMPRRSGVNNTTLIATVRRRLLALANYTTRSLIGQTLGHNRLVPKIISHISILVTRMAEPMFTTMTKGKGDARDRHDVADEIEIELVVERRVEHVGQGGHEQRVAVRRSMHDGFGRDVAACPGPVVDDERLAESIRQLLTQQPRDDVGRAAGRKTDENAHRPRRIGLRPSETQNGRQRGSARSQMQKSPAGKFHFEPPSRFTSLDHLVRADQQRERYGTPSVFAR